MALIARASTCYACCSLLPPCISAGINPRARSLRTAERPTFVRGSAFSLTCFAISFVLDVEQRRHRLVVMYPLNTFPEKLGDAKHRGLKSFHAAHGRAVGRY